MGLIEDPPQRLGADLNRHVGKLVEEVRVRRRPLGLGATTLRGQRRKRAHESSLLAHQPHDHDVIVLDALEAKHGAMRAVREQTRANLLDGDGAVRPSRRLAEALHQGPG